MSSSEVRMTPRPAKTAAWSIPPLMTSPIGDDPSSCSDNASDNSDKLENMCSAHSNQQNKNRKRKIGNNFNTSSGNNPGGDHQNKDAHLNHAHGHKLDHPSGNGQGSLWSEAESLAADFDGSLSGLGADLSTASYDMSEALLALPSLYAHHHHHHHHRNGTSQQQQSSIASQGFSKDGLTPLGLAHLHGGSSVSLPGDFHFEAHSTSPCHPGSSSNTTSNANTQHSQHDQINLDCERRFQYVLAAATSIATKVNEETLTYLNQGQPYEIKLKKLGELQSYRGVVFRSVVRLCFHDRRLQFSEREQISQWEDAHPNDRLLQVDLPLSYGVSMVPVPSDATSNQLSFMWEPLKEVGLYVKVNCISTEFTQKKHGGEKGVPFRLMIETFSHPDNVSSWLHDAWPNGRWTDHHDSFTHKLHAGACQVKVFKLKGADRKHKQDREKIFKKTPGEQAKLQPSYDCTVLSDISLESLDSPPPMQTHDHHTLLSPTYSSDQPTADSPDNQHSSQHMNGTSNATGVNGSNSATSTNYTNTFSPHFYPESVRRWLIRNRFSATKTLWDFSGLDLLRLTKEELIEMCGLAEGIRLFNALHFKITFYVALKNSIDLKPESSSEQAQSQDQLYHPICLSSPSISELSSILGNLFHNHSPNDPLNVERLLLSVNAPGNSRIRVLLTEQLLSTIKDQTAFRVLKNGPEVFLEVVE